MMLLIGLGIVVLGFVVLFLSYRELTIEKAGQLILGWMILAIGAAVAITAFIMGGRLPF